MFTFLVGPSSASAGYFVYNGFPYVPGSGIPSGFQEYGFTWVRPSNGGYFNTQYQYTGNSGTGGSPAESGIWQNFINGNCDIYTNIPAQFDATQHADYYTVEGATITFRGRFNQRMNGNN